MSRSNKNNNEKKSSKVKRYDSYELNHTEKKRFLFFSGLGFMTVSYLFYHCIPLSLVLSCLAYPCLKPYRTYLADKRQKELKEQFRDVLYSVSASVSAGRQMPEALQEAEQNMRLIYSETSQIVKELENMDKRFREYRESEEEILKDFAERTRIDDITDFIDIYLTCRETGGDLIKVITKASNIIMDKITIEQEIQVITAQKRFEAKILTAIPLLIILILQLASPDYLAPMYEEWQGRVLMSIAWIAIAFAYSISMKLTQIEV